jgi:aspartate/glutamate racemase
MTTLGIIGGIAPESTVEYYRTIIRLHQERTNSAPWLRVVEPSRLF